MIIICMIIICIIIIYFLIKNILIIITKAMLSKNPADIKEQTIRIVDKYTDHRLI